MVWPQTIPLSLSFLTDLSLVLCVIRVLVSCNVTHYLQPKQVAQVAQLIQNDTYICAVIKEVWCVSQIMEDTGRQAIK